MPSRIRLTFISPRKVERTAAGTLTPECDRAIGGETPPDAGAVPPLAIHNNPAPRD